MVRATAHTCGARTMTGSMRTGAAGGDAAQLHRPGARAAAELPAHLAPTTDEQDDPRTLRRAFKLACISAFVLTFIMDFLVPMPMFFSEYIFSRGFFTGWVVVSFIWVFASSAISCFLPIWETRSSFGTLIKKIMAGSGGKE